MKLVDKSNCSQYLYKNLFLLYTYYSTTRNNICQYIFVNVFHQNDVLNSETDSSFYTGIFPAYLLYPWIEKPYVVT